jgi:hypothetical protein
MTPPRFRLRTLPIAVAVASGYMGLIRRYEVLGFVVTVVTVPALIGTTLAARRARVSGQSMSIPRVIVIFVAGVAFTYLTLASVARIAGMILHPEPTRRGLASSPSPVPPPPP